MLNRYFIEPSSPKHFKITSLQGVSSSIELNASQVIALSEDGASLYAKDINECYRHSLDLGVLNLIDYRLINLFYAHQCSVSQTPTSSSALRLIDRISQADIKHPSKKLWLAYVRNYNLQAYLGAKGITINAKPLLELRREITSRSDIKRFSLSRIDDPDEFKLQLTLFNIEDILLRTQLNGGRLHFNATIQQTGRIGTADFNIHGLNKANIKPLVLGDYVEYDWSMAELYALVSVIERYREPMQKVGLWTEGEKTLKYRLLHLKDLHQDMSDRIKDKTGYDAQRSLGKKVNFGLNYGLSKDKFHKDLLELDENIEKSVSDAIVDLYFEENQDVLAFQSFAKMSHAGAVKTSHGRIMPVYSEMPKIIAYSTQGEIADRLSLMINTMDIQELMDKALYTHFDAIIARQSIDGLDSVFSRPIFAIN